MSSRCSLDEISLSYNGGKDCLVLLILLLCALATYKKHALPKQLHSVYIISPHPFKEVDAFVDESVATYNLDLARYAMPMKAAFQRYLDEHKKVKAILVGTRRTDPHGQSLTHFDITDSGWPAFMRVHPVIDWHYAEIWAVSYFISERVKGIADSCSSFDISRFLIVRCMTRDTHLLVAQRTRIPTRL